MLHYVTVTSQGQITIPAKIRRKYKFDKNRKVVLVDEGEKLSITHIPDILSFRGIFKTKKRIPFRKTRAMFEEALSKGEA